jgi:hypothetical protein
LMKLICCYISGYIYILWLSGKYHYLACFRVCNGTFNRFIGTSCIWCYCSLMFFSANHTTHYGNICDFWSTNMVLSRCLVTPATTASTKLMPPNVQSHTVLYAVM